MRLTVACLAVAACSASSSTITITYQVPPVGAHWTHHREQSTDLTGANGTTHDQMSIDEDIEVLEVSADQVTREKVTYTSVTGRAMEVSGKTYVIALVGGELAVTGDDGAAVPALEQAQVEKLEHDFLRGDRTQKAISGRPFTQGQAVTFTGDEVKDMLAAEQLSDASMTLTYTGTDAGLARFTLAASIGGTTPRGLQTSANLTGTVALDPRTGRVGSEELSGPITLAGPMNATGTMTISETTAKP